MRFSLQKQMPEGSPQIRIIKEKLDGSLNPGMVSIKYDQKEMYTYNDPIWRCEGGPINTKKEILRKPEVVCGYK